VRTYRGIREPLCHVRVIEDAADGAPPPLLAGTSAAIDAWRGAEHELAVPKELISRVLVPFDWGIDGPGTHYLAVGLLAELLGVAERPGIKAALPFMRRFLSHLPKDDFEISETVFRAFLHAVGVPTNSTPLSGTRGESADGDARHQPASNPGRDGS
jgi:hypothetical protein